MIYQDTQLTWHDFYLACAAASATFAGLLFVALSLHLRIVVTHPEARSLARITLSDYFAVLLVSLFLLTPAGVPQQTGIELIVISGVSLALISRAVSLCNSTTRSMRSPVGVSSGFRGTRHTRGSTRLRARLAFSAFPFRVVRRRCSGSEPNICGACTAGPTVNSSTRLPLATAGAWLARRFRFRSRRQPRRRRVPPKAGPHPVDTSTYSLSCCTGCCNSRRNPIRRPIPCLDLASGQGFEP